MNHHNILLVVSVSLFAHLPFIAKADNNLLLTGQIETGDTQVLTVPWSQTWNHQIKWLRPEGESVKIGDPIVTFDSSGLEGQLEQLQTSLRQSEENAKNSKLNLEKDVINAEHGLIKAELELELAKASIDIPKSFRSQYEEDNLLFEFNKATKNLTTAKAKLTTAHSSLVADIKKQAIEVNKRKAELELKKTQIESLQLVANREGIVLHANHPWNGTKISEGQSVQTTWQVASIPGKGSEYVKTWINEVDWPKVQLNQKAQLTLDAYPNIRFEGEVKQISHQAESKKDWGASTYYDVQIKINNLPPIKLVSGMSVGIELLSTIENGHASSETDLLTSGDIN